jgi:hypothetical protein
MGVAITVFGFFLFGIGLDLAGVSLWVSLPIVVGLAVIVEGVKWSVRS